MDVFSDLSVLPYEVPVKREVCSRCHRPSTVCVCSCLPSEPVPIRSRVIILQHPHEVYRGLATVPLLQECVSKDRVHVVRSRRFSACRDEVLGKALSSSGSLVLYPGANAIDVKSVPQEPVGAEDGAALIVIDGTWAQAKAMFNQNICLQNLQQIQLNTEVPSKYVIRTQPTKRSLSTLESVAYALSWLEAKPELADVLVEPLQALCQYQLEHGAVPHHSKEDPGYIPRHVFKNAKKGST